VSEFVTTYRIADDFQMAGRTFKRGQILAGDDPDVNMLLRLATLIGRQMLFVRIQRVERPALSARAHETVAWRMQERRHA
jgi:hypothetical protein